MSKKKFKVVTLCGSTKFKNEFYEVATSLSIHGYIVLMPHLFEHYYNIPIDKEQKERFDNMHRQMIDMSDCIVVINKEGYIGESTKSEIEYAKSKGKKVYYQYTECKADCKHNGNDSCLMRKSLFGVVRKFSYNCPMCLRLWEVDK